MRRLLRWFAATTRERLWLSLPARPGAAPELPPSWWWQLAPWPGLGVLLALGLLGVALSSHLDSRTATHFERWRQLPTGRQPNGLALADDDGDGDLDVWVGHERERVVHRYRNDGHGRFTLANRWPSSDGFQLCLPDLNEDGRPDVVVASFFDSLLTCNLSRGPGHWDTTRVVWRGARSFDTWAGDLDGDGHSDLLVANHSDSTVVLFGDGHGNFPARLRLAAGRASLGVLAADVDQDGDRDILVTGAPGRASHFVRLYRNEGNRHFKRVADIPANHSPQRLALADVDGDGDPDLLVTAYVVSQVDLCLNDGHGNFEPPRALPTGAQPFSLSVVDVDADGALDVLTTSAATHSVSLLHNLGKGRFAPPVTFEVGVTPTGLAVGDLDGDGEPDLATTDYADDTVTLLRHARPPLVWWPLAAAAGLATGYTGLHYYQRRRQHEARLRSQLAADLHDELGILLTRITMRAELLETQQPTTQAAALVQESRSAAAAMRDIIWNVDTGTDTVEALLNRLRDLIETIRQATTQEIRLQLHCEHALRTARLRPAVRQHTFLIAREALTNALKHGDRAGELAVALHLDAANLLLTVHNAHRPQATGRGGQGLRSMQARATTIGATLQAGPHPEGSWRVQLHVAGPLRGWR